MLSHNELSLSPTFLTYSEYKNMEVHGDIFAVNTASSSGLKGYDCQPVFYEGKFKWHTIKTQMYQTITLAHVPLFFEKFLFT